jgi:hypothetical protein
MGKCLTRLSVSGRPIACTRKAGIFVMQLPGMLLVPDMLLVASRKLFACLRDALAKRRFSRLQESRKHCRRSYPGEGGL